MFDKPNFLAGLIVAALGALVSGRALAVDLNVTWTNPTTRTDQSVLPASELRGTRIEYGTCGVNLTTFGTKIGEAIAGAGLTAFTIAGLALTPNNYCLRGYARAVDQITPANFLESVASNVASRLIPSAPPGPMVLVSIQSTAYMIQQRKDRIVLVAVGTVGAGISCDGNQPVLGYYVVPRAEVQWFNQFTRPEVVVAQCG